MTNHLNNVCIMQKYNDSEKVLELREKFKKSEAFIKKAVNCHDELVEALKTIKNHPEYSAFYSGIPSKITNKIEQALKKASE